MFHVKHSLEKILKELNIKKNSEKTDLLLLYLEELMRWNKKINLVSRKLTKEEILAKLIFPSLIPIKIIGKDEKILDFGAGGGIASIPSKIFKKQITLHLLEAKNKSIVFLEHISLLLDLDLKTINKFVRKTEDIEEKYDWIFVRAVNPEEIPQGLGGKILYYGKYTGDKFDSIEETAFKGNIISVLS